MSDNKNLPPTPETEAIDLDPETMAATNLGEMVEHQLKMTAIAAPDVIVDIADKQLVYLVSRTGEVGIAATLNENKDSLSVSGNISKSRGSEKEHRVAIVNKRATGFTVEGSNDSPEKVVEDLNRLAGFVANSVPVSEDLWHRATNLYEGTKMTAQERSSILRELNEANRAMSANDEDASQTAFTKLTSSSPVKVPRGDQPQPEGGVEEHAIRQKRMRGPGFKKAVAALTLVAAVGGGMGIDRAFTSDETVPNQPVAEAPAAPGQAAEEARVVADIRQHSLDSARVIIDELGAPGTASQMIERSNGNDMKFSYTLSNDTDIARPKGPIVSAELDVDERWLTVTSQSASEATDPRSVTIGVLLPTDSLALQKAKVGTVTTKDILHVLDDVNSTDITVGSVAYDEAEYGHNSVQYANDGLADVYDASQPRGRLTDRVASANTIGDNLASVVNALSKEFENAQR